MSILQPVSLLQYAEVLSKAYGVIGLTYPRLKQLMADMDLMVGKQAQAGRGGSRGAPGRRQGRSPHTVRYHHTAQFFLLTRATPPQLRHPTPTNATCRRACLLVMWMRM